MDLAGFRYFVLVQGLETKYSDDVRMCCQRFLLEFFFFKEMVSRSVFATLKFCH